MIKYKEDREKLSRYVQENREAIDRMDSVELSAALVMFNDRRLEEQIEQQRAKEGTKVLGLSQAITDMLNDSEKQGLERGEKLGLERGEKLGLERGEKRLAQLCGRLMEAGRLDDMKRTFTDREFRESLYEKFGIRE